MENDIVILEDPEKGKDTISRIKFLIEHIDPSLIPEISDIDTFCKKINTYAVITIVKKDEQDIGFSAVYMNDHKTKTAHITYLGLLREYQNLSTTNQMMKKIDDDAKEQNMQRTVAEIHHKNKASIYGILRNGYVYFKKSSREGYNVYIKHYSKENE